MGTPGVPLNIAKDTIVSTLKKRNGRLIYAAKDLDVAPATLRKKINADPELVQLLNDLRHEASEHEVQSAIDNLMFAMSKRETDLGNALRASFYILNHKGKDRGYGGKVGSSDSGINEIELRDFVATIPCDYTEVPPACESPQSFMEDQQSLLDQGQRGEES